METALRARRKQVQLLRNGGAGEDDITIARCKYQAQLDEYKRFSKVMGLPEQMERVYTGRTAGRIVPSAKVYANWQAEQSNKEKERTAREQQHRRKIGDQGQEIIDKPTYNRLTRTFRNDGGVIIRGEDAARHLEGQGAYASYINGGKTAFIRDDATVSDVLEEMYHAEQDRKNLFFDCPYSEMLLRREIDAQRYLLSVAEKYKIPTEETETTRRNLAAYEERLKRDFGESTGAEE